MRRTRRTMLVALSGSFYGPARRDGGAGSGADSSGDGGGSGGSSGSGQNNGTGNAGTGGSGQQGGQNNGQGGNQSGTGEPQTVDQLPGWAQRHIAELRRQSAENRVNSKSGGSDADSKNDGGGKDDGKADQSKADAEQITKERDAAQATARDSVVQLAAYKRAGRNGADPDALADSMAFADAVKGMDPTAADFETKLDTAIKKAVEGNPKLRATPAAGRSGGEFAGGPGGQTTRAKSMSDAVAARYASTKQ